MTEKKRFLKDFSMVLVSNVVVLLASILTGLVVPKLLGVTNYGYYKLFTLYLGYTALLHFGFVDGVLLMFGEKGYDELDKRQFRLFSRFFLMTQIVVSALIIALGVICFEGVYRFICVMIGIDTLATNFTMYYQYISQGTMRFKELSIRKVLQALLKILFTVIFYCLYEMNVISELSCYVYISVLVAINFVLLIWYVYTYRDITFGQRDALKDHRGTILQMYKVGIVLTVSFQVANLVFSIDRQFVSLLFDTETYAVYSFAYSLISIVTSVIGALSFVLFPTLKRMSVDTIIRDFAPGMAIVSILVFAAQIGYYPLCAFIDWYLPDYVESVYYLKIIFPGVALSCCISIIMFTYYKALNKVTRYFTVCCVVLVIAAALNGLAYAVFKSPGAISGASVVTLLIWYILAQVYFIKTYHVKWAKNLGYILLMMVGFYTATFIIDDSILGTIAYTVYFAIVTLIFYRKLVVRTVKSFIR